MNITKSSWLKISTAIIITETLIVMNIYRDKSSH